MDIKLIQEKAYKLMGTRKAHLEREVGGIYYHGQRCANIAIKLRDYIFPNYDFNDDIIKAACYFHDCAKGIEPHPKYGAVVAKEALVELVTDKELDFICDIIAKHKDRNLDNSNTSDYVKIVQDADLIEHFGIYEIWMCFQYYSHTNGSLEDAIKFYEEKHSIHTTKFRKLLNFDISKKIFDEKVEFEKTFIERLKIEGKGGICYQF